MWDLIVGLVQSLLTVVAAASGGSVGFAIVAVSLALRVALLPLTIRLARRAAEQQRLIAALQPELAQIKTRYAKEPEKLGAETLALYRKHGVQLFDKTSATAILFQLPLASALYSAIRRGFGAGRHFLWIADLAKPDAILVAATGALTFLASYTGSSQQARASASLFATAITIAIMWRLSAALGLYWFSSTAIGFAQSAWIRYRRAATPVTS